ncbi:MAG: hypothetical protein KTR31_12060 [Myxococcales bacterium]|nr:hypothetical protein [Myxococcales bacterium]
MMRWSVWCALLLPQWSAAGTGPPADDDDPETAEQDGDELPEPGVQPAGLTASTSLTVVSGPTSGSATAQTLTGPVPTDGMWNPRMRLATSASLLVPLPSDLLLSATWGIWRDQALCDTCDDGAGPGAVGNELLGSTDLMVSLGRRFQVGDKGMVQVALTGVLPASRDALVCNPLYGAPGASAGYLHRVGGTSVLASARFARPFFRYSAAPVGLCAPRLRNVPEVDTLAGAVEPTPWDGTWSAGANPSFTASTAVAWLNPHAVFAKAPARLTSQIRVGLDAQRNRTDPATAVPALTGEVAVERSARPLTASIPWSIAVGVFATDRTNLGLTLGNRLPTWLADPGGTLRALPARTSLTLSMQNRF